MASLRSMILDGGWAIPTRGPLDQQEHVERQARAVQQCLRSHDTVLVNATSVAKDLDESKWEEIADLSRIPCPKPPFRSMWLEVQADERFGFMINRADNIDVDYLKSILNEKDFAQLTADELNADTAIQVLLWEAFRGRALYLGRFTYWLNTEGDYQCGGSSSILDPKYMPVLQMMELWVLHAFARMNCHNVKLVPMTAGAPKLKPGSKHRPFSVWHEIVVTSLPQLRREQKGEIAPDGEKRDLRFHKVRGHYADYTKGKGLFGRLKVRIWVEEHTAGDPELGTVMSSYRVE